MKFNVRVTLNLAAMTALALQEHQPKISIVRVQDSRRPCTQVQPVM